MQKQEITYFLGCIACTSYLRLIGTDIVSSMVCVLGTRHVGYCAQTSELQMYQFGSRNHTRCGCRSPHWKGCF